MRVTLQFDRMERKVNRDILESMLKVTPLKVDELGTQKTVEAFGNALAVHLNKELDATSQYVVDTPANEATEGSKQQYSVRFSRRVHGNDYEVVLDPAFFQSPDYGTVASMATKLDGMLDEGASITRGERSLESTSFQEVMEWLLSESKRGLKIQRYKGLGEMNPDQLWETTMDPAARRMLQVSIEDAIVADEVFDTLMGDQVEPRRDFIERNALSVSNLDV